MFTTKSKLSKLIASDQDMKSISEFGADFLIAISRSELRFTTVTLLLIPSHAAITARAVAPAPITKTLPFASRPLKSSA